MADNEVVIKVSGDSSDYKRAIQDAGAETNKFDDIVKQVASSSVFQFTALFKAVEACVDAFAESEQATAKLTAAMQNQGIYSKQLLNNYQDIATELQDLTGISDEVFLGVQGQIQAFAGHRKVTKELTLAVTDFASAMRIDVSSAADLVGKSLSSNTNLLARYGIQINTAATEQEKMAEITKKLNDRFEGQAKAAGDTLNGSFNKLKETFNDLMEVVGAQLGPSIKVIVDYLTKLTKAAVETGKSMAPIKDFFISVLVGIASYLDNWGSGFVTTIKGVMGLSLDQVKNGLKQMYTASSEGFKAMEETQDQLIEENIQKTQTKEKERQEMNREVKKTYQQQEKEDQRAHFDEILAQNEEFQAMNDEQKEAFRQANEDQYKTVIANEQQAKESLAQDDLKRQIKQNNDYLKNQQKFGTAYAAIYKVMHSEIFQGTKQAFGDLAELQQSSNSTLKGIGKVAAVANIVIRTAESAMNIYAGFSTIPIIGPALGIAGAAAAIAFGAEQIGKVNAAAYGGLLQGGIPGIDSIPVLAQQGELISPAQNFEEVIGSVRAQREAEKITGGEGGIGGQQVQILIGLDGREASQMLTARQIQDRRLGISPEAAS